MQKYPHDHTIFNVKHMVLLKWKDIKYWNYKINSFASSNTQRGMVTQINQTNSFYEVKEKFMKRNKKQFESWICRNWHILAITGNNWQSLAIFLSHLWSKTLNLYPIKTFWIQKKFNESTFLACESPFQFIELCGNIGALTSIKPISFTFLLLIKLIYVHTDCNLNTHNSVHATDFTDTRQWKNHPHTQLRRCALLPLYKKWNV